MPIDELSRFSSDGGFLYCHDRGLVLCAIVGPTKPGRQRQHCFFPKLQPGKKSLPRLSSSNGVLLLTRNKVSETLKRREENDSLEPVEPVLEEAEFTARTTGLHRIAVHLAQKKQPVCSYAITLWSAGRYTVEKAGTQSPRLRKLWEAVTRETMGSSASADAPGVAAASATGAVAVAAFLAENK